VSDREPLDHVEEDAYAAISRSLDRMPGEAELSEGPDGRGRLRFPVQVPCPVEALVAGSPVRGWLALVWEFDPTLGRPDHALASIYEGMEISDDGAKEGDWLVFEASLPCQVELAPDGGGIVDGELRAFRWPLG
jgi:hypothetical protein